MLEPDLLKWGRWLESNERRVAHDRIDDWVVSTIFLGLDCQLGIGPPQLFETCIFMPSGMSQIEHRCSTWNAAEVAHAKAVRHVNAYIRRRSFRLVKKNISPQ